MSESSPSSNDDGLLRRKYERLRFRFPVTLQLENGRRYKGMTQDVSVRGLLFVPDQPTPDIHNNDQGVIALEIMGAIKEFNCLVAHIGNQGIGIHIYQNAEQFGFTLTNAIFGETSLNLGTTIIQNRDLQLTVIPRDRPAQNGRVMKLSTHVVEFCLLRGRAPLTVGDTAELKIQETNAPLSPLLLKGLIISATPGDVSAGCNNGELHCGLRLDPLNPDMASRLKSLVLHHHRQKLDALTARRAMANTLLSGYGDPEKRTIKDIGKDLNRFFPSKR